MPAKIKITIENPVSGCGFTSANHARRYVRRGVAVWTSDTSIRFCEASHTRTSALRTVRKTVSDGAGYATLDAIAGLPCVNPIALLIGKRTMVPGEQIHRPEAILSRRYVAGRIAPAEFWPADLIMTDVERQRLAYSAQ